MGERHIVATGDGGFSDDDPLLDDFILGLTGKDRPRVCCAPTDVAAYRVEADGDAVREERLEPRLLVPA
jgi:hypothetical protein